MAGILAGLSAGAPTRDLSMWPGLSHDTEAGRGECPEAAGQAEAMLSFVTLQKSHGVTPAALFVKAISKDSPWRREEIRFYLLTEAGRAYGIIRTITMSMFGKYSLPPGPFPCSSLKLTLAGQCLAFPVLVHLLRQPHVPQV